MLAPSARRRMPSLNALRSFEAAARHSSLTRAAEELSVTQTAISHQVSSLERELDLKLFIRRHRMLILTEEGRALAEHAQRAFQLVAEGMAKIKGAKSRQNILTVGISPTCVQLWLAQRLNRFWRKYPNIELRVHHTINSFDLPPDVDIAVWLGRGRWPGVEADFMVESCFAPFCSPDLKNGKIPLSAPEDLRHHTLLHAYDYELWHQWLHAAGVDTIDFERGPIIDDPFMLERTAVEGRGIALCPLKLLGNHLADGRLVRVFPDNPQTDFAYYIVYAPGTLKQRKISAFRDFLIEEGRCSPD